MRPAQRLVPLVTALAVALPLAACGEDSPTPATPTSSAATTSAPTPSPADGPEQRRLTAAEVKAALPGKDEGPYPASDREIDPTRQSTAVTDPESCLALELDTPEMRTFKKEHMVAGGGQIYLQPQDFAAPQMSVTLWSHDEVYPQRFFDEAGAALAECGTLASGDSPDDSLNDLQATSIPTPAMGDQSFGVRIGREEFDMAVDYLWVRSGHNLISVRMRTGYTQSNDKRLATYAQGVLDELAR
ncbi:hypothetical protein [Janibacter limosus]|uniref:Sensor domain-containing protein n=1 Tax=Janibacter limosus TaxID=53458 RepID=A0A4P6MWG9_9MICO|nr:hypothetical protein [Janibacter limosus]QBF47342.1 hypothetical protein EXU32_14445 [Janibacter limosus]